MTKQCYYCSVYFGNKRFPSARIFSCISALISFLTLQWNFNAFQKPHILFVLMCGSTLHGPEHNTVRCMKGIDGYTVLCGGCSKILLTNSVIYCCWFINTFEKHSHTVDTLKTKERNKLFIMHVDKRFWEPDSVLISSDSGQYKILIPDTCWRTTGPAMPMCSIGL